MNEDMRFADCAPVPFYDQSRPTTFNDDMIRRVGLPRDVMSLLHDLCYHYEGRDVWSYVNRAQLALMARKAPSVQGGLESDGSSYSPKL